jgi:hypothetical protein
MLMALLLGAVGLADAKPFYKDSEGVFSTRPPEGKSLQTVDRFGPAGIGINLLQPAFVMQIKNVEEGSPAAATGQIKAGQFIETINGEKLKDIDPRIQLGNIITAAEAKDGVLKFAITEKPGGASSEVVVKIPVLGEYSKTWPMKCPKSDKIVRDFADYISKAGSHKGFGGIGILFLLSTGEEKDLEAVRQWARAIAEKPPVYAWHLGFGGIPLCEYYLRTGDQTVLPGIQKWVDSAVKGQYLNAWAGRGGVAQVTYGGGGGHLNAGGTAVVTFLMLARECGANVPDQAFNGALTHFYRWAGRGLNPYGNNKPERGFVDNGKNGNLAFVMAAAAALTPNGEKSVYAGARDVAAANGFYSTSFMLHGHTGGGIGEIWRSASMGLLHDKKPNHYRDFMDQRRWHYELSRRFDGSFGILDGSPNYDNLEWGAAYPLAYTIPRKTLRISGSPPTKFSKQYQLPERPWGTKADDAFLSLEPAAYSNGTIPDFSKETVAMDSGKPALAMLTKSDVSDDTLLKYCHHPDSEIRRIAASKIMGVNLSYLAKPEGSGGEIRTKLANELLRSKDPRVRRSMLDGIATGLSGDKLVGFLGSDGIALLVGMLKDPDESWWVIDGVLSLLASAPPDTIAPHVDVILPFLKHKEWWLQNAALSALVPVATDARCYKKVLEPMGEMMTTCQVYNATSALSWTLMPKLEEASPEVQSLAVKSFQGAFSGFTGVKTAPGGQDITVTYDSQLDFLASSLVSVPGGADVLFKLAKERFPEQSLPYSKLILSADSTKFGPELKAAIGPIIRDNLIKEYIAKNRLAISNGIDNPTQRGSVTNSMDGLVELYHKIGIRDYDWKVFGPDLINAKWHYFTFDPPEEQKYDISPWRYRPVTYPKGMENWFASDFDPAKAGWKSGQFPIGQFNGKLAANRTPETRPDNIWPTMPRTLWEKEVLLVSGTFDLPAPKPGHIHRLRIQTGQGVGAGDGFKVFINGKPLAEAKEGLGRGGGDTIRGAWITREVANDFGKGPVTIAATSFLRYGDRAIVQMPPIPQGIFSMWLEEMKIPPME